MSALKNIKLILAYDGTVYHGWQRQKNAVTIQEILEDKLSMMTGEPVTLLASGRTDAGVHALHQVCNFKTNSTIPPDAFQRGLNSLLNDDVLIKEASYMPDDFHSRYDAQGKIYEYRILHRKEPDIFLRDFSWHIPWDLDLADMEECLQMVLGEHDFSAFKSAGSSNINPVREIRKADLQRPDTDNILKITLEGNGFLRHMVRNIVGTIVEVSMKKRTVEEFRNILESKDREIAGIKAPAQGLFLTMVKYGPNT